VVIPKIKNWSKARDSKKIMRWRYDGSKRSSIEVRKKAGSWVIYTSRGTAATPSRRKIMDNKEDARKWAVEWMRKHPKG